MRIFMNKPSVDLRHVIGVTISGAYQGRHYKTVLGNSTVLLDSSEEIHFHSISVSQRLPCEEKQSLIDSQVKCAIASHYIGNSWITDTANVRSILLLSNMSNHNLCRMRTQSNATCTYNLVSGGRMLFTDFIL